MNHSIEIDIQHAANRLKNFVHGGTYLVTGATGMIGRYIVRMLLQLDDVKVIAACRSREKADQIFSSFLEMEDLLIVEFDVCRSDWPIEDEVDYIIHAAGICDNEFCEKYPEEVVRVNTLGVYKALKFAEQKPGKKVVVFSSATELSRKDDKVMCVIGDTEFSVFEEYEREFRERFVNVGIAEQNFVSFGAGLAAMGMKPFIYNVASFMCYRAFEQIELDVCYQENPVVLVGVGGGHAYGTAGPTHHAYWDVAMMAQLPNMTVLCPSDPVEMRECVKAAYELQRPAYIRIGRSVDPVIHAKPIAFQLGKGIRMTDGEDAVLLATGTVVKDALRAAGLLLEKGIHVAVYSMPAIRPFDDELLRQLAGRYAIIYTMEEHSVRGGLAGVVRISLANAVEDQVKVKAFGFPDTFAPVTGSREYLNGLYEMDAQTVCDIISKDQMR